MKVGQRFLYLGASIQGQDKVYVLMAFTQMKSSGVWKQGCIYYWEDDVDLLFTREYQDFCTCFRLIEGPEDCVEDVSEVARKTSILPMHYSAEDLCDWFIVFSHNKQVYTCDVKAYSEEDALEKFNVQCLESGLIVPTENIVKIEVSVFNGKDRWRDGTIRRKK